MPRQLPWLNKGGASKAPAKQHPRSGQPALSGSDDDFFAGTVLERTGKDSRASEDDLQELRKAHKHRSSKRTETDRRSRLPSSSPPPISATLSPPPIEYMQKAVDKFELRDDEWMMVEDEFLQTAKLFTQHLHLAEYERLKKSIEEKEKERESSAAAAVTSPVVPGARPSFEGQMKTKATEQARAQKKATKDFFTADGHDGFEKERLKVLSAVGRTSASSPPARRMLHASGTDSDDLDTQKWPAKPIMKATTTTRTLPPPSASNPTSTPFIKPALPYKHRPGTSSRPSRATPFDLWDGVDLSGPKFEPSLSPGISFLRSTSPLRDARASSISKTSHQSPSHHIHSKPGSRVPLLLDDSDLPRHAPVPKVPHDRLAKCKAARETPPQHQDQPEAKKRKQTTTLDDIPTFLF